MNCEFCNKPFIPTPHADIKRQRFCSPFCQVKSWHKKNNLRVREIEHKSKWKHKAKLLIANRKYYQENKEKFRQWHKERYWRNPELEIQRVINRMRRVRGRGSFTLEEWKALKAKYNFTCQICGRKEPEIKLTRDHIIPVDKDGANTISNIQPLCQPCNSRKWNH